MERAWAAGLFEGEGSISSSAAQRPRLQLKMTNEESVRRFASAMGVGKVYGPYGPYPSDLSKVAVWMWVAASQDDVLAAADLLRPFLSASFATRLP